MRTLESMIRNDMSRYISGGYSAESAARQVKAARLWRVDDVVDRVLKDIKAGGAK